MREEMEPITFLEEGFDSMSRYSKDGKFAYSIPDDGFSYGIRQGCVALEFKGQELSIGELILPTSFHSFHAQQRPVCALKYVLLFAYS